MRALAKMELSVSTDSDFKDLLAQLDEDLNTVDRDDLTCYSGGLASVAAVDAGDFLIPFGDVVTGAIFYISSDVDVDVVFNDGSDTVAIRPYGDYPGVLYQHGEFTSATIVRPASGTASVRYCVIGVDTPSSTVSSRTFRTFTDGDATPDVSAGYNFKTANTSPTTITNFDGVTTNGRELCVVFGDSNTTVDFTGTNLKGNNNSDWVAAAGDVLSATYDGTDWWCKVVRDVWQSSGIGPPSSGTYSAGSFVRNLDKTTYPRIFGWECSVGGTPGTWRAIYYANSAPISVKSFDAVGDGVSDDTTPIQNAINAVIAAGGGVVFFPAGTYKTTSKLTWSTGVTLKGEGPGATSIVYTGSGTAVGSADPTGAAIYLCGLQDIAVSGPSASKTLDFSGVSYGSFKCLVLSNEAMEASRWR